ncbi:MAG: hypothetical protein LBD53_03045 [Tannerella sp.]|jgi:uncharacterized membrane protein|nr:hypothetical protein [Tannerella sp.]
MKKKKKNFMYFFGGTILKKWAVKHTVLLMAIVIALFIYISNHYSCLIKINKIDKLQTELRDLKYELVHISTQLTGDTRPSQVEERVKQLGLDISKSTTPPYKIKKK